MRWYETYVTLDLDTSDLDTSHRRFRNLRGSLTIVFLLALVMRAIARMKTPSAIMLSICARLSMLSLTHVVDIGLELDRSSIWVNLTRLKCVDLYVTPRDNPRAYRGGATLFSSTVIPGIADGARILCH
jgi:hypothetical protein